MSIKLSLVYKQFPFEMIIGGRQRDDSRGFGRDRRSGSGGGGGRWGGGGGGGGGRDRWSGGGTK